MFTLQENWVIYFSAFIVIFFILKAAHKTKTVGCAVLILIKKLLCVPVLINARSNSCFITLYTNNQSSSIWHSLISLSFLELVNA